MKLRAEAAGLSRLASSNAADHAFVSGGGGGGSTTCRRGSPGSGPPPPEPSSIPPAVPEHLAVTRGSGFTCCKCRVDRAGPQRLNGCPKVYAVCTRGASVLSGGVQSGPGWQCMERVLPLHPACMAGHIPPLLCTPCKRSVHTGAASAAGHYGTQEAGLWAGQAVAGGGGCRGGPGDALGAAGPAQVEGEWCHAAPWGREEHGHA